MSDVLPRRGPPQFGATRVPRVQSPRPARHLTPSALVVKARSNGVGVFVDNPPTDAQHRYRGRVRWRKSTFCPFRMSWPPRVAAGSVGLQAYGTDREVESSRSIGPNVLTRDLFPRRAPLSPSSFSISTSCLFVDQNDFFVEPSAFSRHTSSLVWGRRSSDG
jgi:hypothetical protein